MNSLETQQAGALLATGQQSSVNFADLRERLDATAPLPSTQAASEFTQQATAQRQEASERLVVKLVKTLTEDELLAKEQAAIEAKQNNPDEKKKSGGSGLKDYQLLMVALDGKEEIHGIEAGNNPDALTTARAWIARQAEKPVAWILSAVKRDKEKHQTTLLQIAEFANGSEQIREASFASKKAKAVVPDVVAEVVVVVDEPAVAESLPPIPAA